MGKKMGKEISDDAETFIVIILWLVAIILSVSISLIFVADLIWVDAKWGCIQDIKFEYKTVVNGVEEIKEDRQCLKMSQFYRGKRKADVLNL